MKVSGDKVTHHFHQKGTLLDLLVRTESAYTHDLHGVFPPCQIYSSLSLSLSVRWDLGGTPRPGS